MSPENATTKPWRDLFSSAAFRSKLVLLTVDEAHCISEWYIMYTLFKPLKCCALP